ncbi:MAG: hypothetical protein E4H11_10595, partial [Myxococcales bacterium]
MKLQSSRSFALLFVAFIVSGAIGLLTPEAAQADKALFGMERKLFGAPFPPIVNRTPTTPTGTMLEPTMSAIPVYGGASRFENYIEP